MKQFPVYLKATIILTLLFLLISGLYHGQTFLIPVVIAGLFAFLLFPVSSRLEKWKFPRALAIILSILLAFAILGSLIFFFSTQVANFQDDLPKLKTQLNVKLSRIEDFIEQKTNISEHKQEQMARQKAETFMDGSMDFVFTFFSATGAFLAMFALIPIYIFFLTYYREKFENFILRLFQPEEHKQVMTVIEKISKVTQKYLSGLLIDIAILSVLNSIGFLLLGLDYAILLGVLAAVLNIIPYIGVLIGGIFPVAIAILTKDSMGVAIGAAAVCVAVQFIDNNFITPKVVGSSVSLNPLATLMVLIIGGLIWGVAGMMLFIPLLGMLKVVFDNVESLKPYGYLIGEN